MKMRLGFKNPAAMLAGTAAYLTLAPAIILMKSDGAYLLRMTAVGAFNAILTALIAFLILSIRNPIARKSLYGSLALYFVSYALAIFYYILVYDQMLGVPAANAIVDVNPNEASEYFNAFFDPKLAALAIALAGPTVYAFIASQKLMTIKGRFTRATIVGVVIVLAIGGLTKDFLRKNSLYYVVGTSFAEVFSTKREVAETVAKFKGAKAIGVENDDPRPRVHVLVLGESTTRRHMSLYGYDRRTNPLLDSIKDELFIAKDACSSRGATAPALQEMMTFANRDDSKPLFAEPNFIDTLKAAGYRTYWISNQQNTGILATWASIFASSADVVNFVNAMGGTDDVSHLDTRSYDEKLFLPFETALADDGKSKFILLHLMGSHAAYEMRYPEAYAIFGDKAPGETEAKASFVDFWRKKSVDKDAYDNSVVYNDYILQELIERAVKGDIDTLTYLSDHGESLGENGATPGHADGPAPRQVYEIPLLFHVGKRFADERAETVARMGPALDRPFQSDRLIHTLLDLYGIRTPQRHSEWSLFSNNYHSVPRFCDRLELPAKAGVPAKPI